MVFASVRLGLWWAAHVCTLGGLRARWALLLPGTATRWVCPLPLLSAPPKRHGGTRLHFTQGRSLHPTSDVLLHVSSSERFLYSLFLLWKPSGSHLNEDDFCKFRMTLCCQPCLWPGPVGRTWPSLCAQLCLPGCWRSLCTDLASWPVWASRPTCSCPPQASR